MYLKENANVLLCLHFLTASLRKPTNRVNHRILLNEVSKTCARSVVLCPHSRLDSVILPAEFAWHCHITMFKTESPENLEPPGDFPACLLSQGGGGWPT